jgi:hypothetical protein
MSPELICKECGNVFNNPKNTYSEIVHEKTGHLFTYRIGKGHLFVGKKAG